MRKPSLSLARVRVAPHPIEHRVRSDEGFGPSGNSAAIAV
jgi:hypothetical protein